MAARELPTDLVVVGRVLDAWGLKGGLKVARFSSDASALLAAPVWWLGRAPGVRAFEVREALEHGQVVRALLEGISDRDMALALKGEEIAVARSEFPATDSGEYYWVDLLGLEVHSVAGEVLGRVRELVESGAHPILVVAGAGEGEQMIPFVEAIVREVDLPGRRIIVDWEKDY